LTAYMRVQVGLRGRTAKLEFVQLSIEPTKSLWNRAHAGDQEAQEIILSKLLVPKLQEQAPGLPWAQAPWSAFRFEPGCLILPFPLGRPSRPRQPVKRTNRPARTQPQVVPLRLMAQPAAHDDPDYQSVQS
jgi:hypothetical protein